MGRESRRNFFFFIVQLYLFNNSIVFPQMFRLKFSMRTHKLRYFECEMRAPIPIDCSFDWCLMSWLDCFLMLMKMCDSFPRTMHISIVVFYVYFDVWRCDGVECVSLFYVWLWFSYKMDIRLHNLHADLVQMFPSIPIPRNHHSIRSWFQHDIDLMRDISLHCVVVRMIWFSFSFFFWRWNGALFERETIVSEWNWITHNKRK